MNEAVFSTPQEEFWASSFGDAYIERNRSEQLLASNLVFFGEALRRASRIGSCVELGANIGMNLRALGLLYPGCALRGVEINAKAHDQLASLIGAENATHSSLLDWEPDKQADLSLVKGVLIHLDPEVLSKAYEKLYQATAKYILVAEYYNPSPVSVSYRGHDDRLYKRDFAGEMLDRYDDLTLVDYGFAYHRDKAFPQDDINWFLLRKN